MWKAWLDLEVESPSSFSNCFESLLQIFLKMRVLRLLTTELRRAGECSVSTFLTASHNPRITHQKSYFWGGKLKTAAGQLGKGCRGQGQSDLGRKGRAVTPHSTLHTESTCRLNRGVWILYLRNDTPKLLWKASRSLTL